MSDELPREDFLAGVKALPLVSIDLVVRDAKDRVLVGERVNRPAQGSWFVPGGRVRKDETLDAAFHRICLGELAVRCSRADARLLGVFEHHYPDNAGGEDFSTHYVVLAYELAWPEGAKLPFDQHSAWRWLDDETLRRDPGVHPNTSAYAKSPS